MRGLIAAVAVPLALVLSGCTSLGETGDKGYISGDGSVRIIDAADRQDPVTFSGESLTGEQVTSDDYLGQVLVVNKWWSGCGPCRTEMPMLAKLDTELGDDAAVVGIDIRDNSVSDALAFTDDVGVDFPSIFDPKGRANLAFAGKAPLSATPTTVFLDPEGRVAAIIGGPIPSKQTVLDVVEDIAGSGTADG